MKLKDALGKIHHGACEDILPTIPKNCADFLLTDPPFNVGLDYNEYDDEMKDMAYSDWCRVWIDECYRILKPRHYGIIFTGDKKLYYVHKAITESEFEYHHMMKWHKPSCQRALSGTVFFGHTELAFVISKGKPDIKLINRKEVYSDTLVIPNLTPRSKGSVGHPAQRPVGLYHQLIRGFTKVGDVVLEPFSGSGSCPVAAERCGRKFIAMELDGVYVKKGTKRVVDERKRPPQHGSKPIIDIGTPDGPQRIQKRIFEIEKE